MAKKKAASGSFVMAQEIVKIIEGDPNLKGKEVFEILQKRFPKVDINQKSALVAFSLARKKLGIGEQTSTKKATKAKKSTVSQNSNSTEFATLKAARDFVSSFGSTEEAIAALEKLKELQLD